MRQTVLLAILLATVGHGAYAENLVIGEVHSPSTAKGPSGPIVWTNDFGFLVKHELKGTPEYFVYERNPPAIHHTADFAAFLLLIEQLPDGVMVDWINTCSVPVSSFMPPEHRLLLEEVLENNNLTLQKAGEDATRICRCGSTNTTWYTKAKSATADSAETQCTIPTLHTLSATYKCTETLPAENEKYAIALEQYIVGIDGVEKACSEVTGLEVKIQVTLAENANYDAVLRHFAAALKQVAIKNPELRQLSSLWRKGAAPDRKLEKEETLQVELLFAKLLPSKQHIGADKEWKVSYIDSDGEDILSVKLNIKGDASNDVMWFHILYKPGEEGSYGSEGFGDYRGMGAKDAHYFIKVGNVEIRAVASSDEYKNDEAIKGMLNAFRLKDVETL